jgi:hypothetical protein
MEKINREIPTIYSVYTNNLSHTVSRFLQNQTQCIFPIPKIIKGIESHAVEIAPP